MKDPILEDLHATRERLLAESGGNLEGLIARLQKEESESGRKRWVPKPTLSEAASIFAPHPTDNPVQVRQ